MATFPNLFLNQLTGPDIFKATYTSTDVRNFLHQMQQYPGHYGLPDAAKPILENFLKISGPIDILDNPAGVPAGTTSIIDFGAALGYAFSFLPPPTPDMDTGYLPILTIYARLLLLLASRKKAVTMACVMFTPLSNTPATHSDSTFCFGSTIPAWTPGLRAPEINTRKLRAQKLRVNLLNTALQAHSYVLPPLTAEMETEVAQYLANDYVPDKTGLAQRQAPANLRDLYQALTQALITSSTWSYPLNLQRSNDLAAFNTCVSNIVNTENPPNESAFRAALDANTLLQVITKAIDGKHLGLFGHCAETYPVIHILTTAAMQRNRTQGLALMPPKIESLSDAQIQTGAAAYKVPRVFRSPCMNCRGLLRLVGMDNVYNVYISTVVRGFDPDVN